MVKTEKRMNFWFSSLPKLSLTVLVLYGLCKCGYSSVKEIHFAVCITTTPIQLSVRAMSNAHLFTQWNRLF